MWKKKSRVTLDKYTICSKRRKCALLAFPKLSFFLFLFFLLGVQEGFEDSKQTSTPISSEPFPSCSKLPTSKLGIYTKAAVSTDTKPCAQIGR